jgi:hypothetical protein
MFPIEGEADGLAGHKEKIVQFHKKKANFENPQRGSGSKWLRRVQSNLGSDRTGPRRDVRRERFSA